MKSTRAQYELEVLKLKSDRKISALEQDLQYEKNSMEGAAEVLAMKHRQLELDQRQSLKDKRQLEIDQGTVQRQLHLCQQDADRFRSRTESIRKERLQMKEYRSKVPKFIEEAVHSEAHKGETRTKVQCLFVSLFHSLICVFP